MESLRSRLTATLRLAIALGAIGVAALVGLRADPSGAASAATWQLDPAASEGAIEGYTSRVSVAPGEELELHVATRGAERYRTEIYRIGWYGGSGALRVACEPVDCASDREGVERIAPAPDPESGEVRAGWPVTDAIVTAETWRSGTYLVKLILTSGPEAGRVAGVPFIVRAAPGATAEILVVAPVNTWQAYNDWGGLNMYSSPRSATKVSFDRPYSVRDRKPYLDYPLVRFLDQFEYDVAYTTDADVDAARGELANHKVVVVTAHSEYWSKELRDGLEAARGLGTSLAFLGGNTGYWQIRYADTDRRVLELHRSASEDPNPNPRQKTVRWRDEPLNRPECGLIGTQWQGGDETADPGSHAYTVVTASLDHPWFEGTGFRAGDRVDGAVGYEWDSVAPECVEVLPGLTVLFRHEGKKTNYPPGVYRSTFHSTDASLVTYTAPSGAIVLAASSIDFGWSISGGDPGRELAPGMSDSAHPPDPRMQRLVRNALAAMLRAPQH